MRLSFFPARGRPSGRAQLASTPGRTVPAPGRGNPDLIRGAKTYRIITDQIAKRSVHSCLCRALVCASVLFGCNEQTAREPSLRDGGANIILADPGPAGSPTNHALTRSLSATLAA